MFGTFNYCFWLWYPLITRKFLGEYPQYAAAHKVNLALEDEYSNHLENGEYKGGILIPTGKTYTIVQNGKKVEYKEYYYGSNKYIRVTACCEDKVILSNANTIHNGEAVWVKVTPIKWFIDKKGERLISKFVLLSGLNPDIRLFDFFSSHMKNDMFNNILTKDNMLRMICISFYNLDPIKQVEWLKNIPCDCNDLRLLSEEELKRRKNKKYELKKALKGCTYGDVNDKKYVKELIYDLLSKEYGVTEVNISKAISFDIPSVSGGGSWGNARFPSHCTATNCGVSANYDIVKSVEVGVEDFSIVIKSETDNEVFSLLTSLS